MKLKKPTTNKVMDTLGQATGFIAGMALSNGASEVIPMDNKSAVKGLVAATGFAAAILVDGKDTLSKTIRNVGLGMATQQGKELINEVVAPYLPEGDSATTKFIKGAFEQETTFIEVPATTDPALGNPSFRLANPEAQPQFAIA